MCESAKQHQRRPKTWTINEGLCALIKRHRSWTACILCILCTSFISHRVWIAHIALGMQTIVRRYREFLALIAFGKNNGKPTLYVAWPHNLWLCTLVILPWVLPYHRRWIRLLLINFDLITLVSRRRRCPSHKTSLTYIISQPMFVWVEPIVCSLHILALQCRTSPANFVHSLHTFQRQSDLVALLVACTIRSIDIRCSCPHRLWLALVRRATSHAATLIKV